MSKTDVNVIWFVVSLIMFFMFLSLCSNSYKQGYSDGYQARINYEHGH